MNSLSIKELPDDEIHRIAETRCPTGVSASVVCSDHFASFVFRKDGKAVICFGKTKPVFEQPLKKDLDFFFSKARL